MRIPLAAAAALLLAACATSIPSGPSGPPATPYPSALVWPGPIEATTTATPGQAVAVRSERRLGTVRAVDRVQRTVTLEWMGGGIVTVQGGPQLKQIDDLAAGDTILVDVEQRLQLEAQQRGTDDVPRTVTGIRAVDAPEGVGTSDVRATVIVMKVDLGTRIVTLADTAGKTYDVRAGPGLGIEKLKQGDRLLALYAQTIVVQVEKAPPRAPAKP